MAVLQIDFETRSPVNLKTDGAYKYASDPGTAVYMMGWAFDDEDPVVWLANEPLPQRVVDHVAAGGAITAWNAQFERLIWEYVMVNDHDAPPAHLEQFLCTAARARAHGMPSSLGDAARAMGYPIRKMPEGTRLIREYCAQNVPWSDIPEDDRQLMVEYCRTDVEVERGIGSCMRELTPYEWAEFHVNEAINDRGVPLDIPFARAAAEYADELRLGADDAIAALTRGAVTTARQRKTRDTWVLPQLTDDQIKVLQKTDDSGEVKVSFEQSRRDALAADTALDPAVRRYLELVNEAGGASLRKYKGMLDREIQGRLHGALIFNGAGQTGRFSSTGLQVHNLKRSELANIDELVHALVEGYTLPNESDDLAQLVRSAVYTPGGLSWFDWSSIEGRVAPWLAKSPEGDAKLKLYIQGVDPYVFNAAGRFGIPMDEVTKPQRQAGKLQELALQFLGGVGALKVMGVNYGIHLTDDEAEQLRDSWRTLNPWAQKFGRELETAVFRAVMHTGEWYTAGRVSYAYDGGDWLWCKLPSGRLIAYYQPQLEMVETPWGDERMAMTCVWGAAKPKVGEKWPRRAMHGGLFIENVTQGTAGCLLRNAVVRCYECDVPVCLHVHDEIIAEGDHLDALRDIMLDLPDWAAGLPVEGDGGAGTRYGK